TLTTDRYGGEHTLSSTHAGSVASPFRQPKAVFAVAFACVVSFMGIGLVDPILPAISHELHTSPSEVTLLFTSYLVVTAVAMLITTWVSSRLGAKKRLDDGPRGADPGRDHLRHLHRGEQHDHHPGGDDRLAGGEACGLGRLRVRPVHRRRPRAVRGRADGPGREHPLPVLYRGRRDPPRDRHPGHREPPAQPGRAGAGRAGRRGYRAGRCGSRGRGFGLSVVKDQAEGAPVS